ncbi:MAG TPA: alpha/beta fold hydrolase [Candidatus Paceibacterota bacterium]
MKYPIVQVKTRDGLWLYGLHLRADKNDTVFINVHGTASNFYEEYFIEVFADAFLKERVSILSTNNRGAGVYDAYQKSGAAVEKFEDCLTDIDAWIEFAVGEGYKKIVLSGHSLGTEKIVYYMNNGKYADKVTSVVLLSPADSYGSHRTLDGKTNPRLTHVEELLKKAQNLTEQGRGDTFLPRDAYGSHDGIMPKSAESFADFLGSQSKLLEALPFATGKLSAYAKINVPILAVIGDQEEYTAIPIKDALTLMVLENKNAEIHQIKDCDHDFQEKEKELANIVLSFIKAH